MNRPVHRATGDASVLKDVRRELALAVLRRALDEIAPCPRPLDGSTAQAIERFRIRAEAAQKRRNEKQRAMESRHRAELDALRAELQSGDAPQQPRHHYHPARWRWTRALARQMSEDLLNAALDWFCDDLLQVALQCHRADIEPLVLYMEVERRLKMAEKQSMRIEWIIGRVAEGRNLEELTEREVEECRRSA